MLTWRIASLTLLSFTWNRSAILLACKCVSGAMSGWQVGFEVMSAVMLACKRVSELWLVGRLVLR